MTVGCVNGQLFSNKFTYQLYEVIIHVSVVCLQLDFAAESPQKSIIVEIQHQEQNNSAVGFNYREERQKHFVPLQEHVGFKCHPLSHCSLVQF